MRRAIELSVENVLARRGGPFAALIARAGEIVAEGVNLVTSTDDPTAHAEMVAIREACRKLGRFELGGCEIYTSCEPCPMCLGAIYWARLERIVFAATKEDAARIGFDDSFIYQQLGLAGDARTIPMIPLLREEALAAFDGWSRSPDKIPY
jgi:tRNA(Arg) A34 adenosine deaminase TadA